MQNETFVRSCESLLKVDGYCGILDKGKKMIFEQIYEMQMKETEYVGFLCLKENGKDTLELAVMGVLKES